MSGLIHWIYLHVFFHPLFIHTFSPSPYFIPSLPSVVSSLDYRVSVSVWFCRETTIEEALHSAVDDEADCYDGVHVLEENHYKNQNQGGIWLHVMYALIERQTSPVYDMPWDPKTDLDSSYTYQSALLLVSVHFPLMYQDQQVLFFFTHLFLNKEKEYMMMTETRDTRQGHTSSALYLTLL